ncbi:hypothetical protein [Streptomyces sp. VNUA24]|nr:hypothetical protein [Streptomyces sp. VNUA24]WEH18515.1 hypothetical protein PYR72_34530 [Streptomyces sp. VNUA24]
MRPTTWAAAVATILIMTLQAGWSPTEVRDLGVALLVAITLLYSARADD